jgi:lipid-binding SYLF domain-containing protein
MKKVFVAVALFALSAAIPMRADQSKNEVQSRLDAATATLHELSATPDTGIPDKGIPDEVYKSAKCIAVVPHLVKGAFIFGGKHGRGMATCRTPDGGWSAPAFFSISGGSWGLQVGAESIDLVMMIMTDEGAKHLLENKFQVGADVSGAAGPVGRHASAGVDWKLDTQILTYSRSKGLFAGIDLDGSWIEHDTDSTKAVYGKDLTNEELLTGKIPVPAEAKTFIAEVARVKTEAQERAR